MWESPITIMESEIKWEMTNEVLKAVRKLWVDVDEQRLLEMLRGDSRSYDMGYATGRREVCERIIERLEEELSYFKENNRGTEFVSGVIGGLRSAIQIVREEM